MISAIEETLGVEAVIQHQPQNNADMQDTAAEIGKARSRLGWNPQVAPRDGFARTVAWHEENAAWLDGIQL